jgi:microcystin-dependent protein
MALPLPPAGTFSDPALKESEFQTALEQLLAALAEAQGALAVPEVPVATVLACAGAALPPGYLWCRGELVSRTTYAALFAAIGTAFGGGDGSTTFTLPDLRGRSPVGVGDSGLAGAYNFALGTQYGENLHALVLAEMPAHGHTVTDPTHAHSVYDPGHAHGMSARPLAATGGNVVTQSSYARDRTDQTDVSGSGIGIYAAATGITVANAGGNGAHNVMHPVLGLNFIIKT